MLEPKPERDCDSIEERLLCRGWNQALAAIVATPASLSGMSAEPAAAGEPASWRLILETARDLLMAEETPSMSRRKSAAAAIDLMLNGALDPAPFYTSTTPARLSAEGASELPAEGLPSYLANYGLAIKYGNSDAKYWRDAVLSAALRAGQGDGEAGVPAGSLSDKTRLELLNKLARNRGFANVTKALESLPRAPQTPVHADVEREKTTALVAEAQALIVQMMEFSGVHTPLGKGLSKLSSIIAALGEFK